MTSFSGEPAERPSGPPDKARAMVAGEQLASCAACDKTVHLADDFVHINGVVLHVRCALSTAPISWERA